MTAPMPTEPTCYIDSPRYAHLSLPARIELQAMRSLIEIVETEAEPVTRFGQRWYDVSAMLDPREQPDQALDLNREILCLARRLGLIAHHPRPELRHLVCVQFMPL